ncbi:MAG: glycosyltransferase [Rhizobiales bacterium]|nr:glycosyltransferase [Hyphomicrobiales bacterium]
MQCHLVVMAKQACAGRVKTRLARQIGVAEALRVYRTILNRTLRDLSADPRWQTWIAVSPDTAIHSPVWPKVSLMGQGSGDLGQRMQRVFDVLPVGPVVIIGSDVPGIRRADIAGAFAALGSNDAVFGPAGDGGYWLVGQRRLPAVLPIFENVRWSSEHALADTLANLNSVEFIRQIDDLDTAGDYRKWRKRQLR